MSYFSKDFISFFEELAGDNSKEWFDENRKRYHAVIKDPRYDFLELCIKEISKHEKNFFLEPKHAVFRINRDIRFSKNKQPYKTQVSAILSRKGRKDMDRPGLYLQLGQSGVLFACGTYKPPKEHVHAIRSYIRDHPQKTKNRLKNKQLCHYFGELQGEKNKRISKEFRDSLERVPLIANKQFYFSTQYQPKEILRDDLVEFVGEHRQAAKGWNDFLIDALDAAGFVE